MFKALDPFYRSQLFTYGLPTLFFIYIFYRTRSKFSGWHSFFFGQNKNHRLWLLGVVSLGSFLLASLKSVNQTDVAYTSLLYGWIVIFLLFSKDYYPSFLEELKSLLKFITSFFEISCKIEFKFENLRKIKILTQWILPIFLLLFVNRYNRSANRVLRKDLSKITQFQSEDNSKCSADRKKIDFVKDERDSPKELQILKNLKINLNSLKLQTLLGLKSLENFQFLSLLNIFIGKNSLF